VAALKYLDGIISATPTPVMENGKIDARAVKGLVERLIEAGVRAIAPICGTGEYTALTSAQRLEMLQITLEAVAGRVPVIAGVLAPGLGDATQAARQYCAAGADMLLIVTPYYVRAQRQGIVDYFKAIADVIDKNIMLYEIPYRTGIQLDVETVAQLVREAPITAMKACSHDLAYQLQVVRSAGADISILSGEENVYPLHVTMGVRGGFLATSCIFPKYWVKLHHCATQGSFTQAMRMHQDIMPYVNMLFHEHNPGPIRYALELNGLPHGDALPPLGRVLPETQKLLQENLPRAFALEGEVENLAA